MESRPQFINPNKQLKQLITTQKINSLLTVIDKNIARGNVEEMYLGLNALRNLTKKEKITNIATPNGRLPLRDFLYIKKLDGLTRGIKVEVTDSLEDSRSLKHNQKNQKKFLTTFNGIIDNLEHAQDYLSTIDKQFSGEAIEKAKTLIEQDLKKAYRTALAHTILSAKKNTKSLEYNNTITFFKEQANRLTNEYLPQKTIDDVFKKLDAKHTRQEQEFITKNTSNYLSINKN